MNAKVQDRPADTAPGAGAAGGPGVAPGAGASDERTYVTLTLAGQLCGVPVLAVRDILGEQTITRIPLAPKEIAGSLNLRGRIVTAIDLRRRLHLPDAEPGEVRMSVVAEQGGELYALLVDQVSEVMSLNAEQFERNPLTLPPAWAAFSTGVYRLKDRLLAVLDVPRLIALSPEAG
jgi:purine-binding chemotaxis protein CheW